MSETKITWTNYEELASLGRASYVGVVESALPERPKIPLYRADLVETVTNHFTRLEAIITSQAAELDTLNSGGTDLLRQCAVEITKLKTRAETAEAELTTLRASLGKERAEGKAEGIREALGAVKGRRMPEHDYLVSIPGNEVLSDVLTISWAYTRGNLDCESAILSLLSNQGLSVTNSGPYTGADKCPYCNGWGEVGELGQYTCHKCNGNKRKRASGAKTEVKG